MACGEGARRKGGDGRLREVILAFRAIQRFLDKNRRRLDLPLLST